MAEGSPDALKAELRGDAVHLELKETPDEQRVRGVVSALPGIREIVLDGRRLHARADDGAAAVPLVLATLDQAGVPVAAATVARPSLNRFLVTPVRRSAILNAGVVEQTVSTTFQSLVIVLLARLAGARYPGGAAGIAVLVVASVLLGAVFSALSNTMGLLVRERASIIGMSVFLLLPLTFLSTAFMARSLMPGWIQAVAPANPLNWSLDSARGALSASPDWAAVTVHGGWLLALAALAIWLSTRSFRSYQKSL